MVVAMMMPLRTDGGDDYDGSGWMDGWMDGLTEFISIYLFTYLFIYFVYL